MDSLRADLLAFARSLPEVWEDDPWAESVVKVGKKVFVFHGDDGTREHARCFFEARGIGTHLRPE